MDKRIIRILKLIFFSSFFLFGLFKEYGACIYTGLYGCCLIQVLGKKGNKKFFRNLESTAVLTVTGFYLLTCLYGVDKGMSLIGFWRMLGAVFFLLLVMQLTENEKQEFLYLVPLAGAVMTAAGIAAKAIKPLYGFFYVADRLGGFFQYPNTYALFCLAGAVILGKKWEEKQGKTWQEAAGMLLLVSGILLSGSRTVFFLLMLVMAVTAFRSKKLRLPLLLTAAGIVAAGILYAALTGNVQNISRFLTASLSSSTLLGRILYAKDGVPLLLSHPLGLGYLGYYYMEPKIQTAFYSVRFIHNDFLQMALDTGVLPCVLFAAAMIKSMGSKRLSWEKRLLLAVMGLHFLMDFDLEFISIWYLLILLLDVGSGKEYRLFSGKSSWGIRAAAGLTAAAAFWTGLAMVPRYVGKPEISSALLPFYTESNAEVLAKETDEERAVLLAQKIKKQNPYIPEVYDILAVSALGRGDYEEMTDNKKKSLRLQKYNMDAYERYVLLLSKAITACSQKENPAPEEIELLLEAVTEIPDILEETERNTDPLAYKTRDIPDFTLNQEIQTYISQVHALKSG